MAHELMLDRRFKLTDDGGSQVENPVFARVREHFHTAFWGSLASDLAQAPPCYVRVVRVLAEMRDGIVELAEGTAEVAQIRGVIDVDAIEAQVRGGALRWE
eukprot:2048295-Rhodomonas_salina.1